MSDLAAPASFMPMMRFRMAGVRRQKLGLVCLFIADFATRPGIVYEHKNKQDEPMNNLLA